MADVDVAFERPSSARGYRTALWFSSLPVARPERHEPAFGVPERVRQCGAGWTIAEPLLISRTTRSSPRSRRCSRRAGGDDDREHAYHSTRPSASRRALPSSHNARVQLMRSADRSRAAEVCRERRRRTDDVAAGWASRGRGIHLRERRRHLRGRALHQLVVACVWLELRIGTSRPVRPLQLGGSTPIPWPPPTPPGESRAPAPRTDVAGGTALVWAADPTLGANDVADLRSITPRAARTRKSEPHRRARCRPSRSRHRPTGVNVVRPLPGAELTLNQTVFFDALVEDFEDGFGCCN